MKFFTLLVALFVTVVTIAQDTIPNPGFDYWTTNPVPQYDYPNNWNTLNPLTSVLGIYTAFKESANVHSGTYCIKLVTKSIGGQTAPGLVTTGKINSGSGTIDGGIPINSRPTALNGWYRYQPVAGDSAALEIHLFKWNLGTHSHDEIGTGMKMVGDSGTTWTSFSIPVSYTSGATPDSVQLLFFASGNTPQINSTLFLDDLSYDFASGINETEIRSLAIYPNPSNGVVTIDNREMSASEIQLFSTQGKLERTIALREGMNTLDLADMPKGFYVVRATGHNGASYRTGLTVQ